MRYKFDVTTSLINFAFNHPLIYRRKIHPLIINLQLDYSLNEYDKEMAVCKWLDIINKASIEYTHLILHNNVSPSTAFPVHNRVAMAELCEEQAFRNYVMY